MFDNRTPAERRRDERAASITNRDHLAWAKATLARFPQRNDLRDLIAQLEAK